MKQTTMENWIKKANPAIREEALEELKVVHLNINGTDFDKLGKLRAFLQQESPDIMAISETHLKNNDGLDDFYGFD